MKYLGLEGLKLLINKIVSIENTANRASSAASDASTALSTAKEAKETASQFAEDIADLQSNVSSAASDASTALSTAKEAANNNGFTYDSFNNIVSKHGDNKCTGRYNFIVGKNNKIDGRESGVILGSENKIISFNGGSTASDCKVIGYNCEASATNSVSVGASNASRALDAFTSGNICIGSGYYSFAHGWGNVAKGNSSVALGYTNNAQGDASFSHGRGNKSIGACSHSEGGSTTRKIIYNDAFYTEETASGNTLGHIEYTYDKSTDTLTLIVSSPVQILQYKRTIYGRVGWGGRWEDYYFRFSSMTEQEITSENEDGTTSTTWQYTCVVSYIDSIDYDYRTDFDAKFIDFVFADNYAVGSWSHVEGQGNTANMQHSHVIGKYSKEYTGSTSDYTNGDAYVIGNGTSDTNRSNAFRVSFGGSVYANSEFNSTGADYGEFFEWEDGNPNDEDRIGHFVSLTPNGTIRLANNGDDVIGVVSGISSVVGNAYEDDWNGKYLRDVYGRILTEEIEVTRDSGECDMEEEEKPWTDEEWNIHPHTEYHPIPRQETVKETVYKLNPDYDSSKPYIPRSQRKEWDVIGLLGQVIVEDDGTCIVGQRCTTADNGVATLGTQWRVIRRLDDKHIVVLANFL